MKGARINAGRVQRNGQIEIISSTGNQLRWRPAATRLFRGQAVDSLGMTEDTRTELTELEGWIEKISYKDDETGFTIARLRVEGRRHPVTVTGSLISPLPGDAIRVRGEWVNHPRFGEQFKIHYYEPLVPVTVSGIEKYLGSGLIKGIGPVTAARIVGKFGKQSLDIIEKDIEQLLSVEGIGKKKLDAIRKSWQEQNAARSLTLFLQDYGVGASHAARIFRHYGGNSIRTLKENPYRLADDVFGIGFATADMIAEKLGFAKDSPLRAQAGILHVLNRLGESGHVYSPLESAVGKFEEALGIGRDILSREMERLAGEGKIVYEERIPGRGVYLADYYRAETEVASRIRALRDTPRALADIDSEKSVQRALDRLAISPADRQIEALKLAAREKILVITGGPGTGKTTIIRAVLEIFKKTGMRVMLAAPTGRAAKRMSEATGHEAATIHRLLEYSVQRGGFQRNRNNPLVCDILIVDEASMIDIFLMCNLLCALRDRAVLILVGDANQLPSVGAGNVLRDIIESAEIPVVELDEVFRQAGESTIIMNAHRIRQGVIPSPRPSDPAMDDFYFIEREDPAEVLKVILELVKCRLPARFGLDPVDDIQVLTPMNRGIVGTANLNLELQKLLNPAGREISRGARKFRLHDKVMQVRNNYDKEVFNGDIGRIAAINEEDQEVKVFFDGREIVYDYSELDEIVPAYAISVHKSQGSEYPAVVIPVLTQHYMLLQRNLIYTAVTRGKRLVVMIGTKKALAIAVSNRKTEERYTFLKERLRFG
ncbi:MAG: ATP-dependent RecD-like DNA helicase [Syntrophales bacterium]